MERIPHQDSTRLLSFTDAGAPAGFGLQIVFAGGDQVVGCVHT